MKHKRHKRHKAKGHRNASAALAPRRGGTARGQNTRRETALKTAGVAIAGGAAGALGAGIAVGAGIKPETAAIATLVGGAVGAYALKGSAKVAAMGAACAASGQLALSWHLKRQAERDAKNAEEKARVEQARADETRRLATAPAAPAAPGAKRNGYDDDGSGDARNAGVVDEYVYVDE
jgi:hypothetical protein